MEELAGAMLTYCHRIPLAIVILGGILSRKRTTDKWENVRRNLAPYENDMENGSDGGDEILQVLQFGYYELPFYLKPCFLYFGNFPENYEISTQKLYHLWEAEGMLAIPVEDEEKIKRVTSYEIGENFIDEFVQRSLVQVGERWACGKIKTCRIHEDVRKMCLRMCKEVRFLQITNCTEYSNLGANIVVGSTANRRYRRCALHVKKDLVNSSSGQHQEKAQHLRSLLVFPLKDSVIEFSKEIILKMSTFFPLLRVLELEGTSLGTLPKEVGHLIYLRYLSLRNTSIGALPSCFWKLKHLETLDLRTRSMMKLSNKFRRMESLRHLFLPPHYTIKGDVKLTFMVDKMETLKNFNPEKCELEDLTNMRIMRVFSITKAYEFRSIEPLKALLKSPLMTKSRCLNFLSLQIMAQVINVDPKILTPSCDDDYSIHKLTLNGEGKEYRHIITSIASGGKLFPKSLTHLILDCCVLGKQGVLILETLPQLKVLRLQGPVVRGKKMSFSNGSFQKLNQLFLVDLPELEELKVGQGALPCLFVLGISGCNNELKIIPQDQIEPLNLVNTPSHVSMEVRRTHASRLWACSAVLKKGIISRFL